MDPKEEAGLAAGAAASAEGAGAAAAGGGLMAGIGGPVIFSCCLGIIIIVLVMGMAGAIGYALNNPDNSSPTVADNSGDATAGAIVPGTVAKFFVKGGKIIIPTSPTEPVPKGAQQVIMPATKGKSGYEDATSGLAFSCSAEEKKWYMNMRWPYDDWGWNGTAKSHDNTSSLYRGKKVIVYNPKTKKSVVAAICESGPAPWTGGKYGDPWTGGSYPSFWSKGSYYQFDPSGYDPKGDGNTAGRVSGLAAAPWKAIGAQENDVLEYGFAQDQSVPLGPVK